MAIPAGKRRSRWTPRRSASWDIDSFTCPECQNRLPRRRTSPVRVVIQKLMKVLAELSQARAATCRAWAVAGRRGAGSGNRKN